MKQFKGRLLFCLKLKPLYMPYYDSNNLISKDTQFWPSPYRNYFDIIYRELCEKLK